MLTNKTIVFPTDFSTYATHAAKYALSIAKKYCCIVEIVHVVESAQPHASGKDIDTKKPDQEVIDKIAREKLTELANSFSSHGVTVRITILHGKAWSTINQYAQEHDAGLLVIATHGKTGIDRFVFGSVAERVVRHSSVPVLTVKHPEKDFVDDGYVISINRVLVPTDFSIQSSKAVEYASSLCREFGAELHLVHVVEIPIVMPEFLPDASSALSPDVSDYARELLERTKEQIHDVNVEIHLRTGVAYREICATVSDTDADLIVIPKQNAGSLVHVLFGSVAEKVVRRAPCPVLTLPTAV